MRDPQGKIFFNDNTVVRHLNQKIDKDHFLYSDLARKWVENGDLISYAWETETTLTSPRIPFITLPTEWTENQLFAAGELTLRLQSEAVKNGYDLKDASAWNIVFDGLKPVFVDLMSFVKLENKLWRAAGQFSRHFIFPLLIHKKGFLETRECFKMWRDGVPPENISNIMGLSRFITRYWPLMTGGKINSNTETIRQDRSKNDNQLSFHQIQIFRSNLNSSLTWMLSGVEPKQEFNKNTLWGSYENERNHYRHASLEFKRNTVNAWVQEIKPDWALDIGCNAGEFSEIVKNHGSKVICWDADSQAISTLYSRHVNDINYYSILCPVDDVSGGYGWMGNEYPALIDRLRKHNDLVLLLAVIHHLAIAGSVRLDDIFHFASTVTRRAMIVELLTEEDPMLIQLCNQYNRIPSEFSIHKQIESAEKAGFKILKRTKFSSNETRELVWFELI